MSDSLEVGRLRAVFEAVGAKELGQDISKVKASFEQAGAAGKTAGAAIDAGTSKGAAGTKTLASETDKASKKTSELGSKTQDAGNKQLTAAQQARKHAEELKDLEAAQTKVGTAMVATGAAIAAGLGVAIAKYTSFSGKMAQYKSLSQATSIDMAKVSDAALSMGTNIGLSANDVADAEIELTKAGISVSDTLGGALAGSLNLAAAGQIDVGDATSYATIAMTQFKLSGKDIPHLADLMAAGADKALGSVGDLGEALSNGGLTASTLGASLEETIGTLAAFAQNGSIGAESGTQLKSMLLALQAPSSQASKLMDEYNISLYDAQGNFVGMSALAGQLQTAFQGVDQATRDAAMAQIFGSYGLKSAQILYSEGAQGITDWTAAVDDSGFAAEQAKNKMDSLEGDVTKLGAAFDTTFIKAGSGTNDVLRFMVQAVTNLVSEVGDLPAPIQTSVTATAALIAATALAGGTFLIAVPKIKAYRDAITTMSTQSQKAGKVLAVMGKTAGVVAGVALVVGIFDTLVDSMRKTDTELENIATTSTSASVALATIANSHPLQWAVDAETDAAGVRDALDSAKAASEGFLGYLNQSVSQKATLDVLTQYGKGLSSLAATDLPSATKRFKDLTEEYQLSGDEQTALLNQMPEFKEALTQQATEAKLTADDQTLLKIALGEVGAASETAAAGADTATASIADTADSAEDAQQKVDDLKDALDGLGSTFLDERSASREYQTAIDDASAALTKNGKTLDIHTAKGRANQEALDSIADKTGDWAAAQLAAGKGGAAVEKTLTSGRDAFIKAAEAMGVGTDEAAALADKAGLSADSIAYLKQQVAGLKSKNITVTADGVVTATEKVLSLEDSLNRISGKTFGVGVKVSTQSVSKQANGGILGAQYFADGVEEHTAQIAKAGDWRVWAEPETGGEAYIPLAESKRSRSKEILARVAKMFGMDVFAEGGLYKANAAVERASAQLAKAKALPKKTDKQKSRRDDAISDAESALSDAKANRDAIKDDAFTYTRDTKRGEIADDFANGNGMSRVDQVFSMARSGNYDKGTAKNLSKAGTEAEKDLLKWTGKLDKANAAIDKNKTALDKATDAYDSAKDTLTSLQQESASMASSIASSIKGTFDLKSLFGETTTSASWSKGKDGNWSYTPDSTTATTPTKKSILSSLSSKKSQTKKFADLLAKMKKAGFSSELIQMVTDAGIDDGIPLAEEFLKMSATEVTQANTDWTSVSNSATSAGKTVADSAYAAQITAQQNTVAVLKESKDDAEDAYAQAKADAKTAQDKIDNVGDRVVKAISAAVSSSKGKSSKSKSSSKKKSSSSSKGKKAAGGISPGIYPYTPGGIETRTSIFAEKFAEGFVPLDPMYRVEANRVMDDLEVALGRHKPVMAAGGIIGQAKTSTSVPQIILRPVITVRNESADGVTLDERIKTVVEVKLDDEGSLGLVQVR